MLTGVTGEPEQEWERCAVGSMEDLIGSGVSCGDKCCSQVLCWAEIGGDTAGLPRCSCKWIFIYSGSRDKQGLLCSSGVPGCSPMDKLASETKQRATGKTDK